MAKKPDVTVIIVLVVLGFVAGIFVGWLTGGGANFVDNKLRENRMREHQKRYYDKLEQSDR